MVHYAYYDFFSTTEKKTFINNHPTFRLIQLSDLSNVYTVFSGILVDTFFPCPWVLTYLTDTTYLSFFKNGRNFQLL